ncbi:hypothetical protein IEQ34_001238 [Dendrobium chrysotoxum]|uniref:Uncharacterized protein n=1 Tax=Dendrobium chrysotoxum TaxID=161865 RepID=A0AAV7H6B2_DENCH|nr:hypothetical protein IEQ34_001238 [Dendrobium chrysotoxum]
MSAYTHPVLESSQFGANPSFSELWTKPGTLVMISLVLTIRRTLLPCASILRPKLAFPTRGPPNDITVTIGPVRPTIAFMSSAAKTASAAPRLWPVNVKLIAGPLSNSLRRQQTTLRI